MELKKAMDAGRPMILIDALQDSHQMTIKGAVSLRYAGAFGTFDDQIQIRLASDLTNLLQGRTEATLIFFCQGVRCWESYNAALRARAAGFQNVSWYRGGLRAWQAAGLPMQPSSNE
jgi:PQQ-dependent catabolism-associated CXXCW motif protein